jgi:hypothetical protein
MLVMRETVFVLWHFSHWKSVDSKQNWLPYIL